MLLVKGLYLLHVAVRRLLPNIGHSLAAAAPGAGTSAPAATL